MLLTENREMKMKSSKKKKTNKKQNTLKSKRFYYEGHQETAWTSRIPQSASCCGRYQTERKPRKDHIMLDRGLGKKMKSRKKKKTNKKQNTLKAKQ